MFERIKNIFYRPDFFRRQEFTNGQAFGFYSLSVLALVIGFSLLLIPAAWGINRFFESAQWQEQRQIIENLYPNDLVLTLDNGKLTTNQAGPVAIPFPKEWESQRGDCFTTECQKEREDFPTNLLVINNSADISRKSIKAHDTLVLASETEIGFSNKRGGEIRIFAINEFNIDKKIEVTKSTLVYWIGRGTAIVQTALLFLIAVLPLLMYLVFWVGYVVYSLVGALIVWLAAHIRHHRLTYSQAYRSTLYLLPASFVLMIVMSALSFRIPLLFSLVLFGMALINFKREENEHPTPSTLPQPNQKTSSLPPTPPRPIEASHKPQ